VDGMPMVSDAPSTVHRCIKRETIRELAAGKVDFDRRKTLMNEINSCVYCKRIYYQEQDAHRPPAKKYRSVGT